MCFFQQKVAELKRFESTVYTICLSLSGEEGTACAAGERALILLFQDSEFWQMDEQPRKSHLLKLCVRACMEHSVVAQRPVSPAI
ncbi:hypothetical protein RB620_19510 [Paenibacillus sp. LHD-117]|uniref:hypothetical protein n=1 Tax=Paenibacillus sp. LHD-117 TaxID=3071412 RepID=UPI0027DEE64E|nr:hypothetical protein [Paenibacillus sp. LHD-117]MDQ6421618.1 hypothetical protein [Paenibacillus sp. LHD-117]